MTEPAKTTAVDDARKKHAKWCNSLWWGTPEYYGEHTRGCMCPSCCGKERSPDCDCHITAKPEGAV